MRILLTNSTLDARQGTELYLYDVACELLRRGHTPIAYSTRLGTVAAMLNEATIPVIDDLAKCGETPDVIHGQHTYETLTASLYFPETPVVNFCHGWMPPQEEPLRLPRVLRYVAIDRPTRERLVFNFGIDPARVSIVPNFADLERFQPGPKLAEKPRRALAFGHYFTKGKHLAAIEEACAEAGIALDMAGAGSGKESASPEQLLPGYDLVFGKGRAALEAMAVGCAVVLAGIRGCGELVTSANWADLREKNFGPRTQLEPYAKEFLLEQIRKYDPADAVEVQALVRERAGLRSTVDRLTGIYQEAIEENRALQLAPHAVEKAAALHLNLYSRKYFVFYSGEPAVTRRSRAQQDRNLLAWSAFLRGLDVRPGTLWRDASGRLDLVKRDKGSLVLAGWMGDARLGRAASAILVVDDEMDCLAVGMPYIPRPDASQTISAIEDRLGFLIECEAGMSPVSVLALMSNGDVFDITGFGGAEAESILKNGA